MPFVRSHFPDTHRFVQDNDPKHTSIYAREFMADNNINWWKWPAESADLNPIECVWNEMKRNISKRDPTTKDQLVQYINDFWTNVLTVEKCNVYIDHIYKTAPVVILAKGKPTHDLPKRIFGQLKSSGKSIAYFERKLEEPDIKMRVKKWVQ